MLNQAGKQLVYRFRQHTLQEARGFGSETLIQPRGQQINQLLKGFVLETHGVGECWLVDPMHETVEVWTLDEGAFTRQGAFAGEDTFKSRTLDKTVSVKAICEV